MDHRAVVLTCIVILTKLKELGTESGHVLKSVSLTPVGPILVEYSQSLEPMLENILVATYLLPDKKKLWVELYSK